MGEATRQTAALDETLRRRFEAAWSQGSPLSIEDCLPEDDQPAYLPTLEELVLIDLEFRWEQACSASAGARTLGVDESLAGPPRVEDYLRRFPRLDHPKILLRLLRQEYLVRTECHDRPNVEEYRRRFPRLEIPEWDVSASVEATWIAEDALTSPSRAVDERPGDAQAPRLPIALGHYELLDEIGRGGMGVVYRARQCNANRTVALKVIRRDLLQSLVADTHTAALERFRHEVEAAASLQHANIVAVYEVGDHEGEPFFSMQYVDGSSLAESLREGPLENHRAARYMEQVARAVAAAHAKGILHRDLKPQNILVERVSDRPLVADFGLAKLQDSSDELTHSGDVMGSPPYMSPEQAKDSSRVSFQSDVYSLGATLYHLLTGRPPFQAATRVETIYQVVNEIPVPPRRLNVRIDQDLETICLKCLEKPLTRRYASAEHLADELRRYLEHKPILARHLGPIGRSWRWCQRNRATATALALAVSCLIAALVAATVGYLKTSASLVVAQQAKQESDESFRQARSVVDRFFTEVSENDLLDLPSLQPLRRKLLEEAIAYYQQFLEQRGNDPTLRDELAATHFRVGRIRELLGAPDEALQAYQRARAIQEPLLKQRPGDPARVAALGDTANGTGRVLHKMQNAPAAIRAYREAIELRERLVEIAPQNTEFARMLANTYMNIGLTYGMGDAEQARQWFDRAGEIRENLAPQDAAAAARIDRDRAMGHFNYAVLETQVATGGSAGSATDKPDAHLAAAEGHLLAAIAIFEDLVQTNIRGLGNRYRLATCYRLLADVQSSLGKIDMALQGYEQSRRQIELLAGTSPDVAEYQATLAGLHMNVGLLHGEQGLTAPALTALAQARELLERLVLEHPDTARYRFDLVLTLLESSRLVAAADTANSRERLEAARVQLEQLISADPEQEEYPMMLREVRERLRQLAEPAPGGD